VIASIRAKGEHMSRQPFGAKPSANAETATAPSRTTTAKAAEPKRVAAEGVEVKPNADAVRRRAYELYAKRVAEGKPGDDKSDWAQAERELRK
jgi:hypothetical protein